MRATMSASFEKIYLSIRAKEERIYTDEQLHGLPKIEHTHIYNHEWKIRKESADRLLNYLQKKEKALTILEIGCGNGWLSAKLAQLKGSHVIGIDINSYEIDQAGRVFNYANLHFETVGIEFLENTASKFDIIVFAASIQYFPSLKEIVRCAKEKLTRGGEIHILDTNFYQPNTVKVAIQNSVNYFQNRGYPEMNAHYFHHLLLDFESFTFQILYHPKRLINRIIHQNPFYWVCVYKD
jgi:2-polyprenyl-3-methyl-5-hydroxy-6-metoxy-1,4-benzoquinol methylase